MLILACEVLRPELELLAYKVKNPPRMIFLSQRLHDYPDQLRNGVQEEINRIEDAEPQISRIIMGYGLCGKGLTGVTGKRVTLVYPRLHDCIPLLLGLHPDSREASSREGTTYWISAGWLDSFLAEFHLGDARLKKYAEKFGLEKAARMVKAEDALLDSYTHACHIRWEELGDRYVEKARAVAKAAGLEYAEQAGKSHFIRGMLAGGSDKELFLHIPPGKTIDMDTEGRIIATEMPA